MYKNLVEDIENQLNIQNLVHQIIVDDVLVAYVKGFAFFIQKLPKKNDYMLSSKIEKDGRVIEFQCSECSEDELIHTIDSLTTIYQRGDQYATAM